MSSKFTLQALTLAGILAVSGLPAFAAEMTPATPAPGAAVHSDVKGDVSGKSATTNTNLKADTKVLPTDKKDGKEVLKNQKDSKALKKHEQTAKVPAPTSIPAPSADVKAPVAAPATPAQR